MGLTILGLDPGTRVTGFGLVRADGSRLALVEGGILAAEAGAPLEVRLARIAAGLRGVLDAAAPDEAAMEDAFVRTDPRAALMIGHGRGALLAVLGEAGIPVRSYPPATVKRSVTGNGRASKEQVARMVQAILGTARAFPKDATDALAVAVAHAMGRKTQLLVDQEVEPGSVVRLPGVESRD